MRTFRRSPRLRRRHPHRDPKLKLVVVCEGRKTEPTYLNKFVREHGNNLVKLDIIPGIGTPVTVVNRAVELRKKLERDIRDAKDSFEKYVQVWGVFDFDQHPDIPRAKSTARDNNVKLGISNPCFELWAVLHFREQDAPIECHALQADLMQLMPGYNRGSSKTFDYELMAPTYETAKERAQWNGRRREEERNAGGNPSTDVYKLLELIIVNGKR